MSEQSSASARVKTLQKLASVLEGMDAEERAWVMRSLLDLFPPRPSVSSASTVPSSGPSSFAAR